MALESWPTGDDDDDDDELTPGDMNMGRGMQDTFLFALEFEEYEKEEEESHDEGARLTSDFWLAIPLSRCQSLLLLLPLWLPSTLLLLLVLLLLLLLVAVWVLLWWYVASGWCWSVVWSEEERFSFEDDLRRLTTRRAWLSLRIVAHKSSFLSLTISCKCCFKSSWLH